MGEYWRLTGPGGQKVVYHKTDFTSIKSEIEEASIGETWALELVEMSDEEFGALLEFEGW